MKIMAVAGASGGHIYPCLSFLEQISRDPANKCLLVLPEKGVSRAVNSGPITTRFISVRAISRSSARSFLVSLFHLFKGSFQSLLLLLANKPDVVVGFGSICSLPVVLLAWILRIRTVVHEQNVIPGKATRFLARIVDVTAVSFERTKEYLLSANALAVTGNPVREQIGIPDRKTAAQSFGFSPEAMTLLVMGGSQGSRSINEGIINALPVLERHKVQVIHLCGQSEHRQIESKYKNAGLTARVYPFFERMDLAYAVADLAVSRAGATSISELIKTRVPALLIPYPYAGGHQYANAEVLRESGCALVINDANAPKDLADALQGLLARPQTIKAMSSAYSRLKEKNGALALSQLVMSCS